MVLIFPRFFAFIPSECAALPAARTARMQYSGRCAPTAAWRGGGTAEFFLPPRAFFFDTSRFRCYFDIDKTLTIFAASVFRLFK
jgi:hypothetical protein